MSQTNISRRGSRTTQSHQERRQVLKRLACAEKTFSSTNCSGTDHGRAGPSDHPIRAIRSMADEALKGISGRFDEICGEDGRRSTAPGRLLRVLLLRMLYSVRSERMLMEQLEYGRKVLSAIGARTTQHDGYAGIPTAGRR